MKINIYYGGRGLIEDPTLYVIEKMVSVLEELRVTVNRYNMYEDKAGIATLPNTLKDCDGVILAASVEWFGIGGYMQQFLDMCWLYADKKKLAGIYMLPVVVATAYGEQDAELTLRKAWDVLGGISLNGFAAYVDSHEIFERNTAYLAMLERKAEDFYRAINQKAVKLPTSNTAVRNNIIKKSNINLTPQESEQLSKFVSNDGYVKQQKEDIEELSAMFKQLLGETPEVEEEQYEDEIIEALYKSFKSSPGFKAKYVMVIPDIRKVLVLRVSDTLLCQYEEDQDGDVKLKVKSDMLRNIIAGKGTFQNGFMSGEITAKGNFKTLRMLDQLFVFKK